MNDTFQRRIWSAAIAGWWTVLIAVAYLTLVWILFLVISAARPAWYQALLGPVGWESLVTVALWAVAVLKICVWLMALVSVWLTLWARRLAKPS